MTHQKMQGLWLKWMPSFLVYALRRTVNHISATRVVPIVMTLASIAVDLADSDIEVREFIGLDSLKNLKQYIIESPFKTVKIALVWVTTVFACDYLRGFLKTNSLKKSVYEQKLQELSLLQQFLKKKLQHMQHEIIVT